MRVLVLFLPVISALSLGGCADSIARRVVRAPNAEWADRLPLQTTVPAMLGMALAEGVTVRRIPVASGAISLRAVIIEPSDTPWCQKFIREDWFWSPAWPTTHRLQPLGTIVILHGLNGSSEWTSPHAACLVNAGFRCVLIDLRGHGESTGSTVSFGKYESADIREALGQFRADGTIAGPLILMGCSLGGSVAIMAATDPTPVAAVIAVAPFAHVGEVAPHFANHFVGWLRWLVTARLTRNTIAAMGRLGDFDPLTDSPLAWAPRVHVPVLLIHGANDDLVPAEQSEQLAKALGGEVTRVVIPGQEHVATVLEPGLTLPIILPWLEHRCAPDAYRAVDGPLVGWVGSAETTLHSLSATWAWRGSPSDHTASWPRPAGGRNVRTWARLPLAWLGHDVTYDLGTIDGADDTWCGPVRLGGFPQLPEGFSQVFRRYVIPGWLVAPTVELTIHLTARKDGGGIRWAAGGTALLTLSADHSTKSKDQRERQP